MSVFDELAEELGRIDTSIKNLSLEEIDDVSAIPLKYMLATGGKHLRPVLCLICNRIVGGDYNQTDKAYLALELVHNGTLVHDDIIDDDRSRRGKPSMHAAFGHKRAVLAGDLLVGIGLKLATEIPNPDVWRILSAAAIKMIQGVTLQCSLRRKTTPLDSYLKMVYLKSASMFEASSLVGGILGNASQTQMDHLGVFGSYFGMAYQLRDDVAGIFLDEELGKPPGSDMVNGDPHLPFVLAMDSDAMPLSQRDYLLEVFQGGKIEPDLNKVRDIYMESGALSRSVSLITSYAEKAARSLDIFEPSSSKTKLLSLLDYFAGKRMKEELQVASIR